MTLVCLSASHHSAPVELRETLNLTPEAISDVFARLPIRTDQFASVREVVILSTCNRLEMYAIVNQESSHVGEPAAAYLQEALGLPEEVIQPFFRQFIDESAVEHLFQVAAGLDSIALGEAQILGQVSQALDLAVQSGSARHILGSLFRSALHAGKRVQTETEISRNPVSISSLAVDLAEAALGSLTDKQILVIGTGKMGGYAIASLKDHGAGNILLTNRTLEHAAEIAARHGGSVLPYENMPEGLARADVVFTSVSSPQPILRQELVGDVMLQRPDRPMTLFDLAVPRNVESGVNALPNVHLFDMDDLQDYVTTDEAAHHQNLTRARSIVESEAAEFEKLLRITPFIGELHKKVEQIRQYEVARTLKHLPNPDDEVLQQIDLLSKALVRRILHEPTMHLRMETDELTLNEYVDTLARLFELSECPFNPSADKNGV